MRKSRWTVGWTARKKLEQRKREIVKKLRKIDEITDLPQDLLMAGKKCGAKSCRKLSRDETTSLLPEHQTNAVMGGMWRQELQEIEQRRNDLLQPEHQTNAEVVAEVEEFTRQAAALSKENGQVGKEK